MRARLGIAIAALVALAALAGAVRPARAEELASASFRVHGASFAAGVAPALVSTAPSPLIGGGGATLAEEGPVGRSAGPSSMALVAGFWAIATQERIGVCGDGALGLGEACDDGGTTSGDGCYATCQLETEHVFEGTAVGGYTVSLTVNGAPISLVTESGWTADTVAAKLADLINSDPTLNALGISAVAIGPRLVTNGVIADVDIQDPGLLPAVPVLPAAGLVALALLLGGLGAVTGRRLRA